MQILPLVCEVLAVFVTDLQLTVTPPNFFLSAEVKKAEIAVESN